MMVEIECLKCHTKQEVGVPDEPWKVWLSGCKAGCGTSFRCFLDVIQPCVEQDTSEIKPNGQEITSMKVGWK